MESIVEEAADAVMGFVWEDLCECDAGAIVDGNMDVLVAGASGFITPVMGYAMAGPYDTGQ